MVVVFAVLAVVFAVLWRFNVLMVKTIALYINETECELPTQEELKSCALKVLLNRFPKALKLRLEAER